MVTRDIIGNELIQVAEGKIEQLENEYKALTVEEDKYYKDRKEMIDLEIDKWYLEEYDKIRSKYGKKCRKEI